MTLPLISDINSYGSGVLVDAVPITDPTSEIPASAMNNLRNDVSAMTSTSPKCIFQFTGVSSGNPTITTGATWATGMDSVWGNSNSYLPTLVRNSTGNITVTFPASVPDQLGNSNLLNIRFGSACVVSGTTCGQFIFTVTSASTATLLCFNAAGSANSDLAGSIIAVEVY